MSAAATNPAEQARAVLRRAEKAFLSTTMTVAGDSGWPYGSLVLVAHDHRGCPLLFLSDLSDHTRNLRTDPRASLLIEETGSFGNPLAGPRAAYLGAVKPVEDEALKARYFRRHPKARLYRDFTDFRLYRMTPERLHMIGGFAKALWVDEELLLDTALCIGLVAAEEGLLTQMNTRHGGALEAIAASFAEGKAAGSPNGACRIIGIDPEGFDLLGSRGRARIPFPRLVDNPTLCRETLVKMAREAGAKRA